MKSIKKLFAILLVVASTLLFISKVSAQAALNTAIVPIPLQPHDVLYSPSTHIMTIMGGVYGIVPAVTLNACGINNESPQFKLDVMGDADTNDINISCASCATAYAAGYRIGGRMFLWHNGITSSMFLGLNAGGVYPTPGGLANTIVGSHAGYNNTNASGIAGIANTYLGFEAGFGGVYSSMFAGDTNVYIGFRSGYHNTLASENV